MATDSCTVASIEKWGLCPLPLGQAQWSLARSERIRQEWYEVTSGIKSEEAMSGSLRTLAVEIPGTSKKSDSPEMLRESPDQTPQHGSFTNSPDQCPGQQPALTAGHVRGDAR